MTQRHQREDQRRALHLRQIAEQAALLDEVDVLLHHILLTRARDGVGAVVVLPRIAEGVPVLHFNLRAEYVVQRQFGLPQRPVVEVRRRLQVECRFFFFFFNDTATTEIYTLSLHDALPISRRSSYLPRPSPEQVARRIQ